MNPTKPAHWFRPVYDCADLTREPARIEFLKVWTGETMIHTYGSAYWDVRNHTLNVELLSRQGVTHWRLIPALVTAALLDEVRAEAANNPQS